MLDNLNGSSESEVVAKMQAARRGEDQTSEPVESTDEAVEELEAAEEGVADEQVEHDQEEATEEVEEPDLYTVKVSGEEVEVSFDDLVSGYSKGSDYTKKTMALADERKAFDEQKSQLSSQVEAEKQRYVQLAQQLEGIVKESEKSIDWEELRDTDPSEYLRQKEAQEKRVQALENAKTQQQGELAERKKQLLASESQKLLTVVGDDWVDPEVKQKDIEGMYEYVYSLGVTPDEASQIMDHRFWLMARAAMKHNQSQKAVDVVKKQVKAAPKTVKSKRPIKRTNQDVIDARKRVKQSGGRNVDDVVALMKAKRSR